MKSVQPSMLTSEERSDLQERHGLCWNTDDDFTDDDPSYHEIIKRHRSMGSPHWYLPFHPSLSEEQFETEVEAYAAAAKSSKDTN